MLDCFKAQERVNGPKEQEDKTLRIKDTSGLHLYRVRPSHSFTPAPPGAGEARFETFVFVRKTNNLLCTVFVWVETTFV